MNALFKQDFDGEMIGADVTQGLLAANEGSTVAWTVVPATHFPGGVSQLAHEVLEQKAWAAISSMFLANKSFWPTCADHISLQ